LSAEIHPELAIRTIWPVRKRQETAAPPGVTASNATPSVTVSWTAPTSIGTSAIKHFKVKTTIGTKTCVAQSPATTCTVTGLKSGKSYSFEVKAVNSSGSSPYSTTVRLEVGVPSAPTGVVASGGTTSGHPSAFVSFTAPASTGGGAILGYYVQVADGTTSTTVTKSAPPAPATNGYTVTGLNATDSYSFAVTAFNSISVGPTSASTAAYPAPRQASQLPATSTAPPTSPGRRPR
jgi:hypothetical protein